MTLSQKAKELIKFFEDSGYPNISEMVDALDTVDCKSVIYCDPYVSTSGETKLRA